VASPDGAEIRLNASAQLQTFLIQQYQKRLRIHEDK